MSPLAIPHASASVVGKLSTLDRFLPVWIGVAMVVGLLLGREIPDLNTAIEKVQVDGISLPIALGLLIMMYPVLAKVRYDRLDTVTRDKKFLISSLILNWVFGPALMFALAWILLPNLPEYRTGLIIVGLARCIAMVIIWNDLACGDREAAAVLVAINSVFQVLMFAVLGWFYLSVLPGWLALQQTTISTSEWQIAKSVLIFLGIRLLAGFLSRRLGERSKGRDWYEQSFLPRIGPWALYALLFTIVILFALQGHQINAKPVDVIRIALPLLAYFAIMWGGGYLFPSAIRSRLRTDHHAGVHSSGQQLRTRDRRRHCHLWSHLRASPGRSCRTTDRSTRPRRSGLCVTGAAQTIPHCHHLSHFYRRKGPGPVTRKPSVLSICVKNGGKSQMARRADAQSRSGNRRGLLRRNKTLRHPQPRVGAITVGSGGRHPPESPKPIDPRTRSAMPGWLSPWAARPTSNPSMARDHQLGYR